MMPSSLRPALSPIFFARFRWGFALAAFLIGILASASQAAIGDWKSYSPLHHATSIIEHGGRAFIGTTGGIRSMDPRTKEEKTYDNLSGLRDDRIASLIHSEDGTLWAISQEGYVHSFDGHAFTAYGQGYAAEKWTMRTRAAAAGGQYLVLGSSKGLTFFDTKKHAALTSLNRFGNAVGDSIVAVLRHGDTLYISTPQAVYFAAVNWRDLLSVTPYGSIFDPRIWKRYEFPIDTVKVTEPDPVVPPPDDTEPPPDDSIPPPLDSVDIVIQPPGDSVAVPEDSLPPSGDSARVPFFKLAAKSRAQAETDTMEGPFVRKYGQLVWEKDHLETYGEGTVLTEPKRVEILLQKGMTIHGIQYSKEKGLLEAAGKVGNAYYIGGSYGLFRATPNKDGDSVSFELLPAPTAFPEHSPVNITAHGGKVYTQSYLGLNKLEADGFHYLPLAIYASEELSTRTLRNLTMDANGNVFIGSWGQGLDKITPEGQVSTYVGKDSCLFPIVAPSFYVVHTLSDPYKNGLWLGMFMNEFSSGHQLAYFDLQDNSFTCFDNANQGHSPRVIETLDDGVLAVGSDAGLFLFQYQTRPTTLKLWKTIKATGDVFDTWGVKRDAFKRLWLLQGGKLAYVDSIETQAGAEIVPNKLESFDGKECHVLAQDPALGLWAGCENGIYRIVPEFYARDTRITRFSQEDGLLSNVVYDVAIDGITGMVWAVTNRGVSRFEGGVSKPKTGLESFKVYPNPFRKEHRFVVFDQLPPSAEVWIHGQDGQVVRTLHSRDLVGFQAHWDGNNDAGRPVKPGVYLWSVKAGSQSKQGRIIVAR